MAKTNRLDQKTTWTAANGRKHVIASMDKEHADHAAGWLVTNAVSLLCSRELDLDPDNISPVRLAQILADPSGEMKKTALYRALMARATASPNRRKAA